MTAGEGYFVGWDRCAVLGCASLHLNGHHLAGDLGRIKTLGLEMTGLMPWWEPFNTSDATQVITGVQLEMQPRTAIGFIITLGCAVLLVCNATATLLCGIGSLVLTLQQTCQLE